MAGSTARGGEVAKFDALAGRWWDPRGPMAALHAMNPLRCGWIAERLGAGPAGLRVLDVGCGAGIACEWFARRGAEVTGIDAAGAALEQARAHAVAAGLKVDYRDARPEQLAGGGYDAVLALEVIEHVEQRDAFLASLARLVRPGGRVFLSTINRTPRSWLFAKFGAEYVLRLLPRGTHEWRMFVTPEELGAGLRRAGLRPADAAGMVFDPLRRDWRPSRDLAVNYIAMAERP